jgi:uncharacterized protein YraI
MRTKNLTFLIIFSLFLASCNLPTAKETPAAADPQASGVDIVATAVELTTVAKLTELAASSSAAATATQAPPSAPTDTPNPTPSFTPSPTPCTPLATANTVANIRSGPGTVYQVVGTLAQGQAATVAGRNDANTCWHIEFSGATGGRAWTSGTVTTTACLPANVQIVAAPPTPQPTATEKVSVPPSNTSGEAPDLAISEFTVSPSTPTKGQNAHVRIVVVNHGNKLASQFTVLWYGLSTFANPSCSWDVMDILPASGSKVLECDFVFQSYYPVNKTSLAIVDSSNHVAESNEGNNQSTISPFGVNKP